MIGTSFWQQQRSHTTQLETSAVQQNLRAATFVAGREIRLAGYQPHALQTAGAVISTAQAGNLTFSYVADNDNTDNDGDGTADNPDELETVTYSLYDAFSDGDTDLGRDTGTQRPLAENIDGLEFLYTLADGTQTTTPAADQLDDIRAIRMTLLARTENPLRVAAHNQSFTTPSGAVWAFNDSFRRIILSTNIICRNAGV